MTGYIHVKEAAKLWNIGERQVSHLCKIGKVNGALKQGRSWMIPVDAEKPADQRIKTGAYTERQNRKASPSRWHIRLPSGVLKLLLHR